MGEGIRLEFMPGAIRRLRRTSELEDLLSGRGELLGGLRKLPRRREKQHW